MPGKTTEKLLEHAQVQYGFVTPEDARELGVDPAQMPPMAARNLLERHARGIYRMPLVPPTQLDPYMEAVLLTNRKGTLSHATALDLLDLCDVNPSAIHLTVPKTFRTARSLPASLKLHKKALEMSEIRLFEGIPIVAAAEAVEGGIEMGLGWGLIDQAIETARGQGLITRQTAASLRSQKPSGRAGKHA